MPKPRYEGPDDVQVELTTVFPRLVGEEGFTIMPRFKKAGVGAFYNGHPVPEKQDTETEKDE